MAIGLFIAAVAPTGRVARGIGAIAVLPDDVLRRAVAAHPEHARRYCSTSATPPRSGAAVPALQDAALGHWPTSLQLLTLAAYAVAFGLAAARLFRWE